MPSGSQPADHHIASHIRLACEDLRAANALYHSHNRYTAYHLEQAVEKLLLAVLVAEDIHVPVKDSHQLGILCDKLPDENPLKTEFKQLAHLTTHATTDRYPRTGGRLTPEIDFDSVPDISAAIKKLAERMVAHFGVDHRKDARTPAASVDPPRLPGGPPI